MDDAADGRWPGLKGCYKATQVDLFLTQVTSAATVAWMGAGRPGTREGVGPEPAPGWVDN